MSSTLSRCQQWFRNLRNRPAFLTILGNNGSTLSFTLTNLISVPVALRYLSKEEFGLWAFTNLSVGYLLLFDFGVSVAIARLVAAPLAARDIRSASRWFTLGMLVMASQGVVMGIAGWLLVRPVLDWFEIPAELMEEARVLWLWMLGIAVVNYVGRSFNAILYAQNRYYFVGFGNMLGAWIGLAVFTFFLAQGEGVLAYAYSSALLTACVCWIPWAAVRMGPDRFHLSLGNLSLAEVRQLYGFSGGLFLTQMAGLILVSGQTLIVTKVLGLQAAAAYNVSSKLVLTARGIFLQLFESFLPGWQRLYLNGGLRNLVDEWRLRYDLLVSAAATFSAVLLAVNPWFVEVWARPDLHLGFGFDLASALFLVLTLGIFGMTFAQVFAMQVWRRALLHLVAAIASVLLGVVFTAHIGAAGVFWAALIAYGLAMGWFETGRFRAIILRPAGQSFGVRHWKSRHALLALATSAVVSWALIDRSTGVRITASALVVLGATGWFLFDWNRSLASLLFKRGSGKSEAFPVDSTLIEQP